VVNESPTDKLIRELKEENARLLKLFNQGGSESTDAVQLMAANNREIESLNTSWEQRLKDERAKWEAMVRGALLIWPSVTLI
jgi:kinesin family protein 1